LAHALAFNIFPRNQYTKELITMRSLFLAGLLLAGLTATADAADVRMYIHHEVADYSAWRKVYDAFAGGQRKLGVTRQAVYQSIENPNDVTVTHDFRTTEKAKAFLSSPEVKSTMDKAGVKGTPKIWITTQRFK
jgi:opacity protein-like surface antigen